MALASLTQLPANVNPYTTLSEYLALAFKPKIGESWRIQLRLNEALSAATILLSVATIGLKLFNRGFWLLRVKSTPIGRVLVCNTQLSYLLVITLHLCLRVALVERLIAVYFGSRLFSWQFPLAGPTWAASYLAMGVEACELVNSVAIANAHRIRVRVEVLSIGALLLNLSLFFVNIGLFEHWSRTNGQLGGLYVDLLSSLAEQQWAAGQAFNVELLPQLEAFGQVSAQSVTQAKMAYGTLMASMWAIVLIFVPAAVLHVRLLRQYARARPDSSTLRRTVFELTLEIVCVLVAGAVFGGLCLYITIDTGQILSSGTKVEATWSAALWTYTLIGLPVHVVLFHKALRPYLKRKARHADGIQVSIERVRQIDSEDGTVNEPVEHLDFAFASLAGGRRKEWAEDVVLPTLNRQVSITSIDKDAFARA